MFGRIFLGIRSAAQKVRMHALRRRSLNKALLVFFAILILAVTVFMNVRNNADRYARCNDFDDRLLLTYQALAVFSPTKAGDIAQDIVPHVMEKYARNAKDKRRTASLCNDGLNYFLPMNVLAFATYLARHLGFTDPRSFSWWLMLGFSGYFLVGVCIFLWGLTRTRNWVIVFLTFLSILPYSTYQICERLRNHLKIGFSWEYYDDYAPRNVLTLLFLAMIILSNKKQLQKYLIPLSTIVTFWHCGQSLFVNGFLLVMLSFSSLASKQPGAQAGGFRKALHRLKDLLPCPNHKLVNHLAVNIVIALGYIVFYSYNLEYVFANWESPLPQGVILSLAQYFLYACAYCKIIVEMAALLKKNREDGSSNSHEVIDIPYFNRILFTGVAVFISMILLILLSRWIGPLLGKGTVAWSVRTTLHRRYAGTMSQAALFCLFLASFLVLQRIYEAVNRYGKILLVAVGIVVAVFISGKSVNYLGEHFALVRNSHENLAACVEKFDQASENEGLNVQRPQVFYWTVIKNNFFIQSK